MAKQLNVSLAFTADTSQAAAQVKNLQQQLTNLINQPVGVGQKLTGEIQEATAAAAELKVHLQNATNIKTGTLDFGKLNQSLKQSGMTLNQYAAKLQSIGPQGQQAFMSLARSVASAEVPLRRTNTLISEMGTTLMNTARWQLSSSILHGFIGSVQKAYGYAKDLNESLNNIRIVTGYNTDQMAKFAVEANKAAKALSTTTTEYTNASLIYYQQGLSDSEVKARADVTIKLANVSRQSAEIVSDQMTSIWNNFYDGSRSLEYYADVVTALGAATASSSEEIAQGLEKFAAVAETVGLSYEYATSALATVTATTRQSADVVGTAFKTLFARIQDLNLGKTLDDGTTLGQYSQALAKVGIHIKDTNGELKSMDIILDEMGNKWDTINKDQQVALAKAVAGVRQYTQLIALMDNWDFMEKNLKTVDSSSGELAQQAKIYQESWEAASKRVKASLEAVYAAVMDDEFFIDLTDGFATLIDGVNGFVKSIGGLEGVLSGLGMILTKVFHQQLAQGFSNLAYNIAMSTKTGAQAIQQAKAQEMAAFAGQMNNFDDSTHVGATSKQVYTEELQMQSQLQLNAEKLTQEERLKLQHMMDQTRALGEQSIKLAEQLDVQKQLNSDRKTQLMGAALLAGNPSGEVVNSFQNIETQAQAIGKVITQLRDLNSSSEISEQGVRELSQALEALGLSQDDIANLTTGLQGLKGPSTDARQILDNIGASVARISAESAETIVNLMGFTRETQGYTQARQRVEEYLNGLHRTVTLQNDLKVSTDNGTKSAKQFGDTLVQSGARGQQSMSQLFATMTSGLMSAGMLISSVNGLMDTIKNPDVSGWEKFGQILTSVSMITISLMGALKGIQAIVGITKNLTSAETVAKIANAVATWAQVDAEKNLNRQKNNSASTTNNSIRKTWKDTWNKKFEQMGEESSGFQKKTTTRTFGRKGHEKTMNITTYTDPKTGKVMSEGAGRLQMQQIGKKQFFKGLGAKIGGAAIVTAAIAAAAFIVKTASDYYNRFEIEAKKAEETAKALQKTYEEVQNAESEFRSNIDSYESAINSLDELTAGTEDYKKAVIEANNAAIELLNTHKNLKYTINDNGLIEIDQASLLAAQRESLQKEARAQATAMSAQQDAKTARLEADKVNFQRTQMEAGGPHWDEDDTAAVAGGVGAGAVLAGGAVAYTAVAASNVWNPVGWAMLIAGAVAAVIGTGIAAFNNDADIREAQTLNALEKFSIENGNRNLSVTEIKAIADQQDPSGKLAESLLKDVDATNNMIAEMRANTEAINRNNELIANQLLHNNDYVTGSDYANEIIERSGLFYGSAYKEALAMIESSGWGKDGIAWYDGVNEQAKIIWQEYLRYAGLSDKNLQLVDTTGTDNNRIFVYLDEQGQRQEKTLAEMQKTQAAWVASTKTDANANQLVSYFKEWSEKTSAADQGIAAFLMNGNFEDTTKNKTEAIQNEIATKYNNDTKAYLEAKLGDLGSVAKKLGYDNVDAMVNIFTSGLTNIDKAWNSIDFNDLSTKAAKNIRISAAQSLENAVKLMNAGQLGEEAGTVFMESLNNLLANVKPEDQEEALSHIAAIDWTQWNAAEQIVTIMRALGYEIDTTSVAWKNFVMQMNIANGAIFDHAKALKDIAKMTEFVNNLSIGDIVSKEDYDMLVQYNDEVARYFRILGDGTYKVIGDPLDLHQKIGKGINISYANAVSGAEANYKAIQFRAGVDTNVKATGYNRDQLRSTSVGVVDTEREWTTDPATLGTYMTWLPNFVLSLGDAKVSDFQTRHYKDTEIEGIKDTKLYNAQIDFIDQYLNSYTDEQIQTWKDAANDPKSQKAKDAATEVSGIIADYLEMYPTVVSGELDTAEKAIQNAKDKQFSAELDYAATAQTVGQLDAMYEQQQIGDRAYNSAQLAFVQQEKWEGMDPNEVEEYANALKKAAENSELLYDNMSQEAAEDVALYVKKMNQGVQKLAESFTDWKSILDESDSASEEYTEAMDGIKDAMSDVLGVSEDFISNKFIIEHLEKIEKAAEGDAEAIDALAKALGREIILDITIDGSKAEKDALAFHDALSAKLEGLEVGFTVNADLDSTGIISGAQEVINAAQMTVAEAQAYFNSLGYEPVFATSTQKVSQRVPVTITKSRIIEESDDGKEWTTATSSYQDGYDTFEGEMDVIAMSSNGKTPQIKELRKTSSGAMNNFSSSNPGGKKSGGGGSKKKKKSLESDKERYYEIEQALKTIANKMDKVGTAKERAFGKAKADLIQQEIDLLDEEIAKTDELLDEIAKYAETDMANLAAFGFTFDENNNITNYDEIMAREIEAYNAAIASGDEGAIAAAEERWKLLEEYLKQFEETMDKWDEETLKAMQLKNQKYEKLFEKLTYSIEVKLDIDEDKLKLLDHALTMLEHQAFSTAEAIALMGDKTAAVLSQIKTYSEGITGLLSLHNIDEGTLAGLMDGSISLEELQDEYGFSDEDIAKLREYRDGLLAANEKLAELRNTVQEKVMESFQEWNEEMDRGIAKIEYLGGVLESYKNIVDLVGKSHLGLDDEFMKNMSKAQVANANDNLRANKAKYDAAVKARENAELELAKARERGDEESVKQWEKTLKQLDEEVQGAHQNMMSSWETALEAASNAFEEAVECTIATFEEAISGTFGSLEDLQAAFDQQTEITERYVDDYKKIYELSKLNRDIINSIDETDNVKAKRALRDLQEEINELQESNTQMSQYDLDHLRKKYELRLAEIALEEAQNAKTQVRMRKDSEGNYSYVFTADENEVEKARQNYEDKLYEMQELNTAYIREMQANILQSEIELANALRALDRSKFASDADYYAEVQRLTDYYTGQRNYNLDELNKGITNNRETYNEDWRSYSDLTGYKISADQQYLDSFNETVYAQLTGYQSIEDAQARFADATNIMIESLKQAYVDWQAAVKLIMETAGTSVEDFAKDAGDAIGKISEDSSEAAGDVEEMAKDFEEAFKKVLGAVTQWQTDYSTAITAAITANTNMATSCTSLIEMLSGLNGGLDVTTQKFAATAAQIEDAAKRIQQACNDAANVSNTTNKTTPPPKDPPEDPPKQDPPKTEPKTMSGYAYSYGGKLYGPFITDKVAAEKAWKEHQNKYIDILGIIYQKGKDLNSSLVAQTLLGQVQDFIKFDTGGYTGSWDSSGRLAMLHQKELVLNAQDTENMLKTVDMVRNIVRVIDLNAGSHSGGLGYIGAAYSGHNAQVIEQEVTIHAEFPNAVNHTEIEMAFDNLINHASQFANRIKK